jgi:hypothetical protein
MVNDMTDSRDYFSYGRCGLSHADLTESLQQDSDAVEDFLHRHNITQLSVIPQHQFTEVIHPRTISVIIGNGRYDGPTLADCVAQSEGRV